MKFAKSARGRLCRPHGIFVKADIKDYYHSGNLVSSNGTVDRLSVLATSHLPDNHHRAFLRKAIEFLLSHQYITAPNSSNTYRSVQGSGMGLAHSSSLMNSVLVNDTEADLFKADTLVDKGIYSVWRYEDDLLIYGSSLHQCMDLLRAWRARTSIFDIKIEAVSTNQVVDFLNVQISPSTSSRSFRTIATIKELAFDRPLDTSSAHFSRIHVRWPISYMLSLKSLCSSFEDYLSLVTDFLGRLIRAGINRNLVELYRKRILFPEIKSLQHWRKPVIIDAEPTKTLWVVLPYHRSYEQSMIKAIDDLNSSHTLAALLPADFKLRLGLSFKNSSMPLALMLRDKPQDLLS
jgi:hypothetical protein